MAARYAWSGLVLVDNVSGKPISNGKINFWTNGTTNDKDTFTAVGLGAANANPLILDSDGRVPEAWSADTAVYAVRVLDENDNVILATVQDISFIAPFTLSSADVLAALAANSAAVDIAGSSMVGSAFGAFADDLTLTAAGSINTSAGATTLGATTISGKVSVDDTTEATSTTLASLQTDGGIAWVLDAYVGDDMFFTSGAVLDWASADVTLTHSSNLLTVAGGNFSAPSVIASGTDGFTASANAPLTMGAGAGGSFGTIRVDSGGGDAGNLFLFGATTQSNGAALTLYGNSHASRPGDFEFHAGGSQVLDWNESTTELTLVGDFNVTGDINFAQVDPDIVGRTDNTGELRIAGGSPSNLGGNLVVYGASHASKASDWELRTSTTNKLSYDHSDTALVASVALKITEDTATQAPSDLTQTSATSTNFHRIIELNGLTIWISDGATAEGALAGVVGDICLNGGVANGQTAYCDAAGTNWTDM